MNNKGFSSKEYFLVFLIVGVIMIGVLPIIFRVIDKSRDDVVTDNVMIFENEVNKEIISYINGGNEVNDGCYKITSDGNLCLGNVDDSGSCIDDALIIDVSGVKPDGGSIGIKSNKVTSIYNIMIDNKYVNLDNDEYYISDTPNNKIICE